MFPIVPRNKMPLGLTEGDHFDASATDLEQLELWNRDCPNVNVGIAPDENFCFFETDSETEVKVLCADLDPEIWNTTRFPSGRPDRACYVFRQTMRTRKAGNLTKTRKGMDNLFEFKQFRVLVVGPGSTHPKVNPLTNEHYVYRADWRTIPAMPDALLNRACEIYGAPSATEQHKMDPETTRQTALLDKFLETYEVATSGDWFPKGKQWFRQIVCPWLAEHENTNQGTSSGSSPHTCWLR